MRFRLDGRMFEWRERIVKIDSTAPDAPSKCPMAPLLDTTGMRGLRHLSSADNSSSSPNFVDVA